MSLIDTDCLVPWTPSTHSGRIGGIPTDRTTELDVVDFGADNSGETDSTSAIQAAINACGVGEAVLCSGSTSQYKITASLVFSADGFSGKTFRMTPGAKIDSYANSGITAGGDDFRHPLDEGTFVAGVVTVTAGLTKGSTTVEVDRMNFVNPNGEPNFIVGNTICFMVEKDLDLPVVEVRGSDLFPMKQVVRVISKDVGAQTITFWPPLFSDYGGGSLEVRVKLAWKNLFDAGFENVYIDQANANTADPSNAYAAINSSLLCNCWFTRSTLANGLHYDLVLASALNCELRSSRIKGLSTGSSNGAGLLLNNGSSCLIEDNILLEAGPLVEVNFGSSGNVLGYNFGIVTSGPAANTGIIDTNHGPHNQFNLYEGNSTEGYQADGYFGSCARDTFFRNHVRPGGYNIDLKRFTRKYQVIGNMLPIHLIRQGYPNIGNIGFTGTAQPSLGDYWADWLTFPGAAGFQEKDLDVEATTVLKGNRYADDNSFDSLGGDTLPDSLYRTTTPDYFTDASKSFPPYDPVTPLTPHYYDIPAGQRYLDELPPSAPEVTSAAAAKAYFGEAFSIQIETDVAADSYTASGLPGWATLNPANGIIAGTPNAEGVSTVTLNGVNGLGAGPDFTFTLTALGERGGRITSIAAGEVPPVVVDAPIEVTNENDGHD